MVLKICRYFLYASATVIWVFALLLGAVSLYVGDAYGADAPLPAVIAGDCQPPTAPTGVTASAVSDTRINIAWGASSDNVGVDHYRLLRGGVQISDSIPPTSLSYQDSGLTANTPYAYRVVAVDAAGNTSASNDPAASATTLAAGGGQQVVFCPPVKTVLSLMGHTGDTVRLPLVPPSPATRARLERLAGELGLLKHAPVPDGFRAEVF